MSPLVNAEDGPCGNQMGAKFWKDGPADTVQDGQGGPSTADQAQPHDPTEQARKRARITTAAPTASDAASLLPASGAAAGHQLAPQQQQQQQQQDIPAPTAQPAAVAALPAAAVANQPHEQQQQQHTEGGSSAVASTAPAESGEFAAGTQLRMWEQKDAMWARMLTNNVFEFTSQGRIQQGSETDVYLVKLDNIVQWRRQPAAADSSEGQSAESRRRGRHPQPSVQVGGLYALKVCRPLQDLSEEELGSIAMPDVRTRLLKEQACYGRLGRRFLLCRCFAYGAAELLVPGAAAAPPHAEQERPCLLLEYAPGGSMAALLQSPEGGVAGMSEQQAREVMRAAAEVLLGCHSERVIYRDVQPSNIVMMQPPEGEPDFEEIDFKLIDFGTSFFMDEGLGSGYRFGLPAYRAPEQGPDYHHTYTLDTWQLGCLLLHLRTGELPLPELLGLPDAEWLAKVSAVHQDILHAEQHPYLQRYTLLSQQEREVISKCLVPAPHARPMTERVFEDCDYFARGGVPLTTEQVHLLQTHLPGAMERYIMSVLEGEKCARQGEV